MNGAVCGLLGVKNIFLIDLSHICAAPLIAIKFLQDNVKRKEYITAESCNG